MFANLPGVQVNTVDGGLAARRNPTDKAVLIIGTSGIGPAEDPYQVIDRSTAAAAFGLDGTLVRAMEEAATYCDNIILYRMGTKPGLLAGVGAQTAGTLTAPITNVARASNIATFTCTNTFQVGDTVVVSGLTTTQLNGSYTVLTRTGSVFTVTSTGATIASTVDSGSAVVTYTVTAGFSIQPGERTTTTGTDYKIWYKGGIIYVYYLGSLIYANDIANDFVVDSGDLTITGVITGSKGLNLGTGAASLSNAVTFSAAAALAGNSYLIAPTLTNPVTGLGMTGRQTYVALRIATDLLQIFPVDQVYCPNVIFDEPNICYSVVSGDVNDPTANPDALDWIKAIEQPNGNYTYQWANDTTDSDGNTVAPMGTVTGGADRISLGFYEAHNGYVLASFCAIQEQVGQGGTCIAIIATSGPASFKLIDTRAWIGILPIYDPINTREAIVSGRGLLGTPLLAGCTDALLNNLTADFSNGYRLSGLFQTNEGEYDGTPIIDNNGNPVDVGAYLHIVADLGIMSNGYNLNYAANLSGIVSGLLSSLDEKVNLTNQKLNVAQLWKANFAQMDSLTQIGINILRFKGPNAQPALLHGMTAANPLSDFQNLLHQRIKGLVVDTLRVVADKFIGSGTNDGLQLQSMKTSLDASMTVLQTRGYIGRYNFTVSTTLADQRIGHARIDITFNPADELVQLDAYVGFNRS